MLKKTIFNKINILIVTSIIGACVVRACMAFGVGEPVFDMENYWKNEATAIKTALILEKETEMLKMQVTSMQHLGHFNYKDLAKTLTHLQEITERGTALSYSMRNLDNQFNKQFPNFNKQKKLGSYKQAYTTWDETSLQTFQNTLAALGVTAKDMQNQQDLSAKLKDQSKTEEGQTRLLQISHELAINTNQHLSSLQEIISAQTNAQTAYMSHKVSKETYEEQSMDELVENAKNYHIPKKGQSYGKLNFNVGRSA